MIYGQVFEVRNNRVDVSRLKLKNGVKLMVFNEGNILQIRKKDDPFVIGYERIVIDGEIIITQKEGRCLVLYNSREQVIG